MKSVSVVNRTWFFMAMVMVFILSSAFSPNGSLTPAASGNNEAAAGPANIVIWTHDAGQFQLKLETWNKNNPGRIIKEEFVPVGNPDYLSKLQTTYMGGGQLPDIIQAEMTWRAAAYELDIWEVLTDAPYNLNVADYYDYVVPAMKNSKGQVIAIENAQNPSAMAYKRDLAERYLGTADPAALGAMFQTYDDYIAKGQEVYQASNGTVALFPGLRDVATMMMNQKRDVRNLDAAGNLNVSAKARDVFAMMKRMQEAHTAGTLVTGTPQWNANIGQKNNIFWPAALWMPKYQIEPNDPNGKGNWSMFRPAGGGFGAGGTSYGIYNKGKFKKTAYDFIQWGWASPEGAVITKAARSSFLPLKSLYSDPEYTRGTTDWFSQQQYFTFMLEELAPEIKPVQISIYDTIINDSINMVVDSLANNPGLTVDAMMQMFMTDLQNKVPNVKVL